MKYEYENLGNGISVPCLHMDLTGSVDSPARKELTEEIYGIIDGEGALLMRDTGLETTSGFSEFLSSIGYHHHSYVGGTSPRTDQGRGVYTATDIPADITIPIHQEMAYLDNVPDYASFFCEDPPENDQKTNLIGDMRKFTDSLPVELKKRYKGKRARLRRMLPPTGKNTGFFRAKKCWQETFGTNDRKEVVAITQQKGWELSWTDDDFLVITQEPARFFRTHPIHGEIWCTQAMLHHPTTRRLIAERDGRMADLELLDSAVANAPDSVDRMIMEDGSAVPPEDSRIWFEIAVAMETPYALGRGDIIVLDNLLMAHGRSRFTGPRRIFTALGDRVASRQTA
jgi:alpha-ketoglutarate-dependent taurine dioxygenase